ncbi:MAG: phosphatidylinositol kinase [Acidobacteria bacterium]|nr:phosphatidylinositol kinase [Acidobacteriota bacterium]
MEHLRRMRGGAQSHLMRCSDEQYYVVKFRNNPQGPRILANEMLASHLAMSLGLPVSEPDIVLVSEWLIAHTPDLYIQNGSIQERCQSGFAFASRFPCDPLRSPAFDYLPAEQMPLVANLDAFAGMLVFDQWTCNCDTRQVVFHQTNSQANEAAPAFHATMIDQGYCFNGNQWNFPDSPRRGLFPNVAAYAGISGSSAIEPWLSRLRNFPDDFLDEAAATVPVEWYEGQTDELSRLMTTLAERRGQIRNLMEECMRAAQGSFPNWPSHPAKA